MSDRPDDICARPERLPNDGTSPLASPIYPSTVYRCDSAEHAAGLIQGEIDGYVYSRYAHPNSQQLAEKCADLHGAEDATITGSGMSALALALLALLQSGDHLVVSTELYGKSGELFLGEATRLGIDCTAVDTKVLSEVDAAMTDRTRLVIVETITNPMLRISDIPGLAEIAHRHNAQLLVDNTFASPIVCQPLKLGADLVMESLTKIMNGHSDVMLGMLCGRGIDWERVSRVYSTWGLFASPMDCWLASRGLFTLALRAGRASENAQAVAEMLAQRSDIVSVSYPGLDSHQDHELAKGQFREAYGSMVTFTLPGGLEAFNRFLTAVANIPFCPSLGELCTTLSHPASSSHIGLSSAEREALDIYDGTIRLSIGVESSEQIIDSLEQGLAVLQ